MILTFRYRIKDKTCAKRLEAHARACNAVWNFCVSTQREAERRWSAGQSSKWPTPFDLIKLCAESSQILGIHSDTIGAVCRQFCTSRLAKRRCPKFRASRGAKQSLGWIPFIPRAVSVKGASITYLKQRFHFWQHRTPNGIFRAGSFSQDSRGRWYVSLQCELEAPLPAGSGEVGIDLGIKDTAVLSDGTKVQNPKLLASYAKQLATAQRAGRKDRARAIHAKIINSRRHHLHVATKKITEANNLICVGDVSITWQVKTGRAKSVLDAGWGMFRSMLRYKSAMRRAVCIDVSERGTTQTCSDCGAVSGPKGIAGLGVRHWVCIECGSHHDRDVNAAQLILMLGRNAALRLTGSPLKSERIGITCTPSPCACSCSCGGPARPSCGRGWP